MRVHPCVSCATYRESMVPQIATHLPQEVSCGERVDIVVHMSEGVRGQEPALSAEGSGQRVGVNRGRGQRVGVNRGRIWI